VTPARVVLAAALVDLTAVYAVAAAGGRRVLLAHIGAPFTSYRLSWKRDPRTSRPARG
jgi:hypothetical protein